MAFSGAVHRSSLKSQSMKDFAAQDENYAMRVRESFSQQNLMKTIGASLTKVLPGEVEISLEFRDQLTQQHGFIHAGIVATLADTASVAMPHSV